MQEEQVTMKNAGNLYSIITCYQKRVTLKNTIRGGKRWAGDLYNFPICLLY